MADPEDDLEFEVVINHEEQYSIWAIGRPIPEGWTAVGVRGPKDRCLAHIDEVWTDMRPKSLRDFMDAVERGEIQAPDPGPDPLEGVPDVVDVLSDGRHPVEVVTRPTPTPEAVREALALGYVHLRFTDTQGGTELGVTIDPGGLDTSGADLDAFSGRITVVGSLVLDGAAVRCHADIDLERLAGDGRLERIDAIATDSDPVDA